MAENRSFTLASKIVDGAHHEAEVFREVALGSLSSLLHPDLTRVDHETYIG